MALLTQYWGLDGLLILFSTFVGVYLYFTRNFSYWKKRGVQEVSPTAFFGNMAPIILAKKPLINFFQEVYQAGENEQYIGYYVLDTPHLLIRDPELIKCILIKDFNAFSNRNSMSPKTDILGKKNLFVVKTPEWRYIRQKLSPIFTTGKLKKMFELMLEIDKDFDVYLDSLKIEGDGRVIDIKDVCGRFTTDLIGLTAYGMKFNALLDPEALLRKVGKDIFSRTYKRHMELFSALLVPMFVRIFGFSFFGKAASNFLRTVFWEAINERLKSGGKRGDLIDLLVDIKKEQENDSSNDTQKMEGDTLVAQAAVFFTGGFETSSSTMAFTFYELAKNKDVQKKLRIEILEALKKSGGKPTYEMIMSLPYLDMVVSETLRMYPVLPFLDRIAETDYQLPGTKLSIKSGTPVLIPMHALHMDPNHFPKPHVFDPERFSPENKRNIKTNTYFPFGDGPRICIGMRLGLLQTKLGLINLISKFECSPCKETLIPMEFDPLTILTASSSDIKLNFKKISVADNI